MEESELIEESAVGDGLEEPLRTGVRRGGEACIEGGGRDEGSLRAFREATEVGHKCGTLAGTSRSCWFVPERYFNSSLRRFFV